ncbi:MAG: NADH:flavin oxidoreductase, partial [Actinomycetota bacterium]|nr:NADH:flavin oxidoreductase [Actinomycetota bacterium]
GSVTLECVFTGRTREIAASNVIMATSRQPQDDLYYGLVGRINITRIGDCLAPGTIATSVYSGHRYARELDADVSVPVPFRRE